MSAAGCHNLLEAEVVTRAAEARCNLLERLYAAGWRLGLAADGALEVDAPEPLDAGLAAALEADAAGIAEHVRRRDVYQARPEIVLLPMSAEAFDAYLEEHPEHPDHDALHVLARAVH